MKLWSYFILNMILSKDLDKNVIEVTGEDTPKDGEFGE